ncbi:DUF6081 family protein [Micromonospora purpureochromogenes]|uniref:DUF6081 family protein n=1 Tax=Micromonospora purpureochromogenes TaxID=47872 RepID=UPI00363702FC
MTDVAPARSIADVPPDRLFHDEFHDGFRTTGPDARWLHTTAGPHVADDGTVHTSAEGLRVVSGGPEGRPVFTRTVAQDTTPGAVPGVLDHVKWLVYTTHRTADGTPGFEVPTGQVLTGTAVVSGRTHGTTGHPFGDQVTDPEDDLRLASTGINAVDPETYVIVDFLLTNRRVYAFYERLPFARAELGRYAAFSYGVPVADRSPEDEHELALSYDRDAGVVRWLLDGREVFRVDRIGHHLPGREHLMLDHGGTEALVVPRQLNFGMGMLTLLDGALPGHSPVGLVRLVGDPGFYVDPVAGEPAPQRFVDEASRPGSRLFGQGAELSVRRYTVQRGPAR